MLKGMVPIKLYTMLNTTTIAYYAHNLSQTMFRILFTIISLPVNLFDNMDKNTKFTNDPIVDGITPSMKFCE